MKNTALIATRCGGRGELADRRVRQQLVERTRVEYHVIVRVGGNVKHGGGRRKHRTGRRRAASSAAW